MPIYPEDSNRRGISVGEFLPNSELQRARQKSHRFRKLGEVPNSSENLSWKRDRQKLFWFQKSDKFPTFGELGTPKRSPEITPVSKIWRVPIFGIFEFKSARLKLLRFKSWWGGGFRLLKTTMRIGTEVGVSEKPNGTPNTRTWRFSMRRAGANAQ